MNYTDFLRTLTDLKLQIENENTGNAQKIATQLGVSRRTVFNYMDVLKNQGHQIGYCHARRTYYFEDYKI